MTSTAHRTRTTFRFPLTPLGARTARRALAETAPPDDVLLVAGELLANAVQHARRAGRLGLLTVTASDDRTTYTVEVTDPRPDTHPPTAAVPDLTAESGRGLLLVDALAVSREIVPHPPVGKTVRVTLAT
ncbi:hypothetical protein SRB5_57050 [Streptomyces sp. RB5]|uniref:Histidine kinase/HSP90-like ATPase domain-containing protein n=1 Tax=Streptomyces smaragdinus TaxID=2585196 RepID=A0A7K0CQB9_9ACTN|nr:ATP-binding protein [Streptomyces smaragdinus]MQY15523.1 hypothetical protein [Streptomyces smaragdinus]